MSKFLHNSDALGDEFEDFESHTDRSPEDHDKLEKGAYLSGDSSNENLVKLIPSPPLASLPSENVAQNTTNYALCSADELINYSQSELDGIYSEAVAKFNLKPKSVREFLVAQKVIQGLPSEIAKFIFHQPKLSKRRIGEYIGNVDQYNQLVCESLFQLYNFSGITLDAALRVLMKEFRLPGEAQQIDRILEKFAIAYHLQNPGVFLSSDTAYVLSFSLIMLNTDLHNHSISADKKMTLSEFLRNNRGINQGKDLPQSLLITLYDSVKNDEIRMDEADMYESEVVAFMAPTKSGWLLKKADTVLSPWKRHWY